MDLILTILLILGWLALGAVGVSWMAYSDGVELKLFSANFIIFTLIGLVTLFCITLISSISGLYNGLGKIASKFPKANITIVKSRNQ
jgi:hypothetical protein